MEQYKHLTCVNNKKDLKDRGKNIAFIHEENLDMKLLIVIWTMSMQNVCVIMCSVYFIMCGYMCANNLETSAKKICLS